MTDHGTPQVAASVTAKSFRRQSRLDMPYPRISHVLDFWLRIHFFRRDFHSSDRCHVYQPVGTGHRAIGFIGRI